MQIDIVTLFPNMFVGPFDESMIKRGEKKGLVKINTHQLRNWAEDKHQIVDDRPFGGGTGMLLKVEPVFKAVNDLRKNYREAIALSHSPTPNSQLAIRNSQFPTTKVVLMDAGGELFNQKKAQELSKIDHLIFLCGHYEGFDYRVHEHIADEKISIGDYVLTGGELPAMIVIDTVARLIPGVLPKEDAATHESFSITSNSRFPTLNSPLPTPDSQLPTPNSQLPTLLEYPQYTRPEEFNGWRVPEVLLTGHHKNIEEWKKDKSHELTRRYRPDLLQEKQ